MPCKGDWVQNVHTGRKTQIIHKSITRPIAIYELDSDDWDPEDDRDTWSEDALLQHWRVIPPPKA
jgi:hypothetical protein